jgi:hypothetical protein
MTEGFNEELLSDTEKSEYREYRRMFESEGWRMFKAELQKELDGIPVQCITSAGSWEDVLAFKARARVILEVLSFETGIMAGYQSQVDARDNG